MVRLKRGSLRHFTILWLMLCLGWVIETHGAELSATVDRQALTLDEHVVLTLTLSNSDTRLRAQGVNPNIDLSVLTDDFHVGSPRDSHRYNLYRGQGRSTSELTVELFPKRTGTLTVPAFHIDGLSTSPLRLTVQALSPGTAPLAFARVSINKSTLWQREQLVAFLDVYSRVALESAQLGGELITEPQPLDMFEYRRLPVQTRSEHYAGFEYQVMRTAWALFPTHAGDMGLQFPEVWIVAKDGTKLRLPSEGLRITVQSLPADVPADSLVGKVHLALTPTRTEEVTHDFYAWELMLSVSAPVTSLPGTLEVRPVPGLQLYVDRPQRVTEETSAGLLQVARYTLTAIPLAPGSYRLPDVQLNYFDPDLGKLHVATAIGPTFEVNMSRAAPSFSETPSPTEVRSTMPANDKMSALPWIIVSALLFVLWLITVLLWRKSHSNKRNPAQLTGEPRRGNPSRPLEAKLLDAFLAPSLAIGLREFEIHHGANETLRNTVQRVQRLYYGPAKAEPPDDLRVAVDHAVHMLHRLGSTSSKPPNPWLPETFTPTKTLHQNR